MRRSIRWILATLFFFFGLFLLGWGLRFALLEPWWGWQAARQAATLPVVTRTADLAGLSPGQQVLVEGRISPDNPVSKFTLKQTGSQATYVVYRVVGEPGLPPALILELADGKLQVSNQDYLVHYPGGNTGSDTYGQQVDGYLIGDPAVIDGQLEATPQGLVLRAKELYPGSAQAYIRSLRGAADTFGVGIWVGLFLALISLPFWFAGWLLLSGRVRHTERAGTPESPSG